MIRAVGRLWRRIFQPQAIRVPGKFPWTQPEPIPFGTTLIDGPFPVLADGRGGIVVGDGSGAYVRGITSRRASQAGKR